MKSFKNRFLSTFMLIPLIFAGTHYLYAQSSPKTITIEDVKKWRHHSITLSDDGMWYTVLYSLTEKPEAGKDTTAQKSDSSNTSTDLYGEDFKTDVLYICHAKNGAKYQIPDGKNPKFSSASGWIAYNIESDSDKEKNKDAEKKKDATKTIELKNLKTGVTRQYKSNAEFQFAEDANYFITSDEKSLLIYDLDNLREHYIGNIGEFLIDKDSEYIAYTISSEDKRGNGIYLYHPADRITRALHTGNFIFSNLSWNRDKNALAAYKYEKVKDKIDFENMSIIVISGVDSDKSKLFDLQVKDFEGMPENMGPAVKFARYSNEIVWSHDDKRLHIKIKKYDSEEKKDLKDGKKDKEEPTVNVWHWKDKKLLSQKMLEEKRKKNETYDAIFLRKSKKIIRLTSKEMQRLTLSEGTDKWAVGMDDREYVSDWDVRKNDLYKVDLSTGKKKLIEKKYSGRVAEISPDGEFLILWKDGHYWSYNFKDDKSYNLTSGLNVSFINKEDDHWGHKPSYGFVGWVKNQQAVIVNHKLDLWLLPLNKNSRPTNLTQSITSKDSIRFRFDDLSFTGKPEIEDRYIDLSSSIILYAFNIKTKYAGYFSLEDYKLRKLIYGPDSYSASRWRSGLIKAKKSNVIIYKMGSYQNYPEAYLSDTGFSKSKKITDTNPQQKNYKWGHRILIDYTNDDGVPLQGILSIPDEYEKGRKLPMLVYSYEKMSQGMYSYATPRLSGASICEMMYVSDGYLVLRPDIHFNVGTPHSDMHECIDAAIEKVIELGYVDEKCIGYEGFSYGGHCGMFMSTQDNRFAAIAAGAGVSNLVQGFNIDIVRDGSNEQDYYMIGQGRLGTDPVSDTEMFISESAVFQAQNMNTPLLLFHGTTDQVVKWEHSFGFYSILRYLHKPVVFLSYRGEGHGLRKKANRLDIQKRLKEYFDHYLKGKDAAEWIDKGLPYTPEKKSDKKKDKTELPMWK
ncbi:S9 family peptidase [bacterium]|nr:S9 family peptidase [bacterium]